MAKAYDKHNIAVWNSDAAASTVSPIHASVQDLKQGKYCIIPKSGWPGVISNVKMSKTGKHGHAKFTFQLWSPFTNQTSQEMHPGHTHLKRPKMQKFEAEVTNWDEDGTVDAIDEAGNEINNLFIHKEFAGDKDGKYSGDAFAKAIDRCIENPPNDELMEVILITCLKGPICTDKKKVQFCQQIVSWQIKVCED